MNSVPSFLAEAIHHLPGLGRARLARLYAQGVRSWNDLISGCEQLPAALRGAWIAECEQALQAWEQRDVWYFCNRLHAVDRWRILAQFLDDTTFFDIETEGLDWDSRITVICCWHKGTIRNFVEHENLDEFLELLDEVTLLASFNGNAFDVPRVLSTFHIPELPCPHVDMRWMCYHRGWRGGLKEITRALRIERPLDLYGVDGAEAVYLWHRWRQQGDRQSLETLLRYCGADVVLLLLLGWRLAERSDDGVADVWAQLPRVVETAQRPAAAMEIARLPADGPAPTRLRAYRRR